MDINGEAKKSPPVKPPRSVQTTLSGSTHDHLFYPKPDGIQGIQVGDHFTRLRFHETLYCLQSLKGNRTALVAKSSKKVLTIVDQFTGDLLHTENIGEAIGRLSYSEAKGILCIQGSRNIYLFDTKTLKITQKLMPFDEDYHYDITIGDLGNLYGAAATKGRIWIWRWQPNDAAGWMKIGSVGIPGTTEFQLWSSGLPVLETNETVRLAVNIRTDEMPYKVFSIDCELDGESGKLASTAKWLEWGEGGPRYMVKLTNGKLVALDQSGQLLFISDKKWLCWDHRVSIHPTSLLQMSADSTGLHYFR